MRSEDRLTPARRTAQAARVSGFTYGTIIVLSVIVASARAYPGGAGHIAAIVAVTAGVFWLAHVYAHSLGHSVAQDERISWAELRFIGRREAAIIESAALPVGMLMLGTLGVVKTATSVWLAIGLALAALVVQAVRYARIEALGLVATGVVVAINVGLGLVLVALKLFVMH
jgi:uncharacterized membrane protein